LLRLLKKHEDTISVVISDARTSTRTDIDSYTSETETFMKDRYAKAMHWLLRDSR